MKKITVLFSLLFCASFFSNAQINTPNELKELKHVSCPVCYASDKVEKSRIPPPIDFLLKSGEKKCNIEVDYVGFSEEAKNAFAYAVEIWESILESDQTIRMQAVWNSSMGTNVLGSCGPETYYANFRDAPFKDRYYPVAIAEKIANEELNGETRYDLIANFNSKIDWYYGTDLNTPDTTYDLVSVVLHEICHGLGFTGFFFVDDDIGAYGFYEFGDATSFDLLVVKGFTAQQLVDTSFFENASNEMKRALESLNLYGNSPIAMSKNNGQRPRLYAPYNFDDGSSIYHLNDATYPHGNENSLMTHAVGKGEAVHDPGPLTRGIMDDIGWQNLVIHFDAPKDMEVLQPVDFKVTFDSPYGIKENSPMVIYSLDGFAEHSDTLPLVETISEIYAATLNLDEGTDSVLYYVSVTDTLGRVKTEPAIAPKELYSIRVGTDTEKPVLAHEAIPYFLIRGEDIGIVVEADDNMGIDTVYVEFSLNGAQQGAFGLKHNYSTYYKGTFPLTESELKDGDEISYTIHAIDEAANPNSAQLPAEGDPFSFNIEEILDAVSTYNNNFNQANSDFLISDFEIYTAENFENGALHSPHPYPSPGIDNQEFDFFTLLKKPIILKEEGKMSFDEVVLVEPATLRVPASEYGDDDFWDYVIVEGSKDFGETWLEIADGYDSGSEISWKNAYNEGISDGQDSDTPGTPDLYINKEIDLLGSGNFTAGDTILIRFRLYSDPYAFGWGWAIDNLLIQHTVAAPLTELSPGDVAVYPNPFSNNVTVNIGALTKAADIRVAVYNMFGQSVYLYEEAGSFGQFNKNIDLSHLGSGMFLVQVSENGQSVLNKKLIKN